MSHPDRITLLRLIVLTIIVHTITYTFMGILAFNILDYPELYSRGPLSTYMRQTSDPIVMAGPLFQPVRGLIFALAFYPLREILFRTKRGWLILWWVLVALGILSTFGPAPASIEGMIYTIIPTGITSYIEVVPQALLLSVILFYWIHHPEKKWLNWLFGILFAITMILPVLGLIAGGNAMNANV